MSNTATPAPTESLQGKTFTFQTEKDRVEAIDKAFNYRGDVQLTLSNGTQIEGYIFNRAPNAKPPQLSLFVKDQVAPHVLPYADIIALSFSGKDPADGNSWRDWVTKKEEERKAEAEKIKSSMANQGYL